MDPQGIGEIPVSKLDHYRHHPVKKLLIVFIALLIALPTFLYGLTRLKNIIPTPPEEEKFFLVESSPSDFNDSFPVVGQPTLVFSKKLDITEKELNNYFHITPDTQGSWHLEKNGQVVYFSSDQKQPDILPNTLAYDTVYTMQVDGKLKSNDNKKLPEDISIRFRTKKDPRFGIRSDYKLINGQPNQPIQVTLSSPYERYPEKISFSDITVIAQTASENQLVSFLLHKKGKSPLYEFTQGLANREVLRLTKPLQYATDSASLTLELPTLPNGLYFIKARNDFGSEEFFVVTPNHINQVFSDSQNTYVWTTDSKTGKSLSNLKVRFYSLKDKLSLIEEAITDNKGLALSKKQNIDLIITGEGNDIAITRHSSPEENSSPNYEVFSYTDRPLYKPGDMIHYKAILRKKEKGSYSIPQGAFYVRFSTDYNSDQSKDDYQKAELDQNGSLTYELRLPQSTVNTYAQIILSQKDKDKYIKLDSLPLQIQSYRKPDMSIKAQAKETEYISKDVAHTAISAYTLYEKPLANVEFSYRVLVNDYSEIKDRNLERIEDYFGRFYGGEKELAKSDGSFDSKGRANIEFSTDLANFEQSQVATLEITPKIGASPSIGRLIRLIHRGEYALFFQDVEANIEKGVEGNILVLDHNKNRQPIGNQALILSIYKILGYQNKELLKSQTITSNAQGIVSFSFPKLEEGGYELGVQGYDSRQNIVTANYQAYVGKQQYSLSSKSLYTLDAKAQKDTYKTGETAFVSALANFPVSDEVVIVTTTDSKNSYSSTIISLSKNEINNTNWVIPIEIPKNQTQSMGVDVFTTYNNIVVKGHTDIKVDTTDKKLITSIFFDKKVAKPKDLITAEITTKDTLGNPVSADISLAIIDASILQIATANINIFGFFYGYSPSSYVTSADSTAGISLLGPGGAGGCFLAGTKIRMADGSLKNIEDVKITDTILTRESELSGNLVSDVVTKTFEHTVNEYLVINDSFNVTPIHRIFLNNKWQEAKEAKIGDLLLNENGNFVKIASIKRNLGEFKVYNLSTKNTHTFFANGFYVHNDKGGEPRYNLVDTAYWNPHIQTDKNGQSTIAIKVPDNLTTFTALAISNTNDSKFGQAMEEFISSKDIAIIPTIPNFYYQNDKPVVSALIQNSSQNDIEANITFSIKELGLQKNMAIHLAKGDFEEVSFPIDLATTKDSLTFLFEAKDKTTGKTLDSILLKKSIMSKGNINVSWTSFEGSNTYNLSSKYPSLDFNRLSLWIVPHIAVRLFDNGLQLYGETSFYEGQKMLTMSSILRETQEGKLPPHLFKYAEMKNNFRDRLSMILRQRKLGTLWSGFSTERPILRKLSVMLGLKEAQTLNLLNEITNSSFIIDDELQHLKQEIEILKPTSPAQLTQEEELLAFWILGIKPSSQYEEEPEFLAVSALLGDAKALSKLLLKRLPSANDRFLWDGNSAYARVLPALAIVEKGSKDDASKAIKGLSFGCASSCGSSIDSYWPLFVGINHLVKNKIQLNKVDYKLFVDDKPFFDIKRSEWQQNGPQNISFASKNSKQGFLKLKLDSKSTLPLYSTIIATDFGIEKTQNPFTQAIDNIANFVKRNSATQNILPTALQREYKNLQGVSSAVVLSLENPFKKFKTNYNNSSFAYSISLIDAISPAVMFLDQKSGNSPQYQSAFDVLFPPPSQYEKSYLLPSDFSDQAVFFDANPSTNNKIIFTYIVFNVSDGSYYQPKTSLVFPHLGLIIKEK